MQLFLPLLLLGCLFASPSASIDIIPKSQWGGRAAKTQIPLDNNLSFVVIHHSAGAYCNSLERCSAQMRIMQSYHMDTLGWDDIGYNFAIGADENIYEGRGVEMMGAHARGWNRKSYGIVFIGNYNDHKPTQGQVAKAKELIDWLVSEGHVSADYTLHGHRQVGSTECPGNHLFAEIGTWPNFKA